jgi:hypothetical protein
MFCNLGIYGFVGELFMSSQERYRKPGEKQGDDGESESRYYGGTPQEERQKFNDVVNQGLMFKEWTAFDHPQFGSIEIGGWRPFTTRIPPTFMLPEMVHRNAAAVIFTAKHAPEVELEVIEVKELGDDMHRIRERLANTSAIPTLSNRALRYDLVRKDILSIQGRGIEVVSGGIVMDIHFDEVRPIEYRPGLIFTSVPSFGKRDIQWIVKGGDKATIEFDSIKAKNRSIAIEL